MGQHPWSQTSTGKEVDLLAPHPSSIDLFTDVAEGLARQARFNGGARSGPYSVAQHCVIGADILMHETRRRDVAAAFLLHDAHEYVVGDITTPSETAISLFAAFASDAEPGLSLLPAAERRAMVARCFSRGLKTFKATLDAVIFQKAGLAWPMADDVVGLVRDMDIRMLATERLHLLERPPRPWGGAVETASIIRLRGPLRVWPWPEAADQFRDRLQRYLPSHENMRPQGQNIAGPRALRTRRSKRRLKPKTRAAS